jgi:hypothetical protein
VTLAFCLLFLSHSLSSFFSVLSNTAGMDPEGADERKQRQKEREAKWIETQIIGFTSLVNSFLSRRKQKIENLETDFKDGLRLADFIELAGFMMIGMVKSILNRTYDLNVFF